MGWAERVAEDARRYQELADRVSRVSISEGSPDGVVRVTVSASGLLTGLELRGAEELAEEIMECLARAQARIPDLLRQAVLDTVGEQDPSAHLIVADARKRFAGPEPEEPEPADMRSDWESRPVLEDV
ncbi:MAG TPA: hypothetical protein VGX25_05600 [Actinophytocola sp.]|uniref:hypothetical protein n=1 Tax=Actinophytocola sp. TaxID=1872138 RepID=UPI002DDCB7BD|nr:hypothetical protein [Actinophytocola sp.]HEV2778858.1 hypothetical protein [Actinophytocola sp.]